MTKPRPKAKIPTRSKGEASAPRPTPEDVSAIPRSDPAAVSIGTQLDCARRELAFRRRQYPYQVGAKRMTAFKASDEIAAMAAIVTTLEGVAAQFAKAKVTDATVSA